MTNLKKSSPLKWLCLAALLLCGCAQVSDHCGDHNPYDPARQFCGADGSAYNKCGGKTYDTYTQGCDASGAVRDKCANGSVPAPNAACGNSGGGADTAHTHEWGGWIITLNATCSAPGMEINTCLTNSSHVEERAIDQLSGAACESSHTHSYGQWSTTAPATCTVPGQETRSCGCGTSLTQAIPANPSAHTWGSWVTTTPATCSAPGQQTRTCTLNSTHTETRPAAQLTGTESHTYGGWVVTTNATCAAPGVETRTCSQNPAHTDVRETAKLTGTACEAGHTHSFGQWQTTVPATCSAQGQERKSCTCGADSVRATAQLTGTAAHTWSDWVTTAQATCSAPGENKRVCTLNSAHAETNPIPQTSTHSWGGWTVTNPATCSAPGVETRVCAVNSEHTDIRAIAQLTTHTWGDYAVTTPATCTAPGTETRYCTVNSAHTDTRAIAQIAHNWGGWTVTTAATCEAQGVETRTCTASNPSHSETRAVARLSGAQCVENGTFVDSRDSKTYKWVKIGTQVWMAENLNYNTANGTGSWCYGGADSNCVKYGRLYSWATAMNLASTCNSSTCASQVQSPHQGVCPAGWHVPSSAEWTTLVNFVGSSTAGTKLKSSSPAWNGRDEYGFSALPGGGRFSGFNDVGTRGSWWSATEDDATGAYRRDMNTGSDYVGGGYSSKPIGYSVRCLRD